MGVEEYRLPITGTDEVSHTPHDYSGAFQGGYSARFTASRRALNRSKRALNRSRRALNPSKAALREKTASWTCITGAKGSVVW